MSTPNVEKFERWIRTGFVELNTQLENLYFAQEHRENVVGVGEDLKQQLHDEGNSLAKQLLNEGNTDEGYDNGYNLLGNVGFFIAACRRHEITNPAQETESPLRAASALAMQLGASLGVVPRFASAHQETHNQAIDGAYKTFTSLADEALFLENNTRGVFALIRASEALLHCLPLGISHPITADLLQNAKRALQDMVATNAYLFNKLDPDRFFYSVRPYFKPYFVGNTNYRGANAGDFAGINVIDLLLGLCQGDDPYYSQILVEKFLYMHPDDQLTLRDCMRRKSLLDSFLDCHAENSQKAWFQKNAQLFIEVCEMHGKIASQHHEMLVAKFIEKPSAASGLTDKADLTASGPPLPVLLKSLKHLCDLRNAADVPSIKSRYSDMQRLRSCL
ncbi:MAG: hypothetical protein ACI9SX_000406 [Pseudoalteromonas tetraodonis]|jgi:hypothetical protein